VFADGVQEFEESGYAFLDFFEKRMPSHLDVNGRLADLTTFRERTGQKRATADGLRVVACSATNGARASVQED
jgi:hypothetical protein